MKFINKSFRSSMKGFMIFAALLSFVLIINMPMISFDMMYPEQTIFYVANQEISHLGDLINIYLHPKLFATAVPFFRPSGHFLMYQLIIPLLGWHNTKGLMIINFIFLTLASYFIIQVYQLLFPRFKIGGYIAVGIYLMHPALNLSRLIAMHFEFAYVFFLMLSLYFFILFCQKQASWMSHKKTNEIQFHHFGFLAYALLIYIVAVTFKEPAVMLGPVLLVYFSLSFQNRQSLVNYSFGLMRNRQTRHIIFIIMMMTVTLFLYLTLAWPILMHPFRHGIGFEKYISAMNEMLKNLFSVQYHYASQNMWDGSNLYWHDVVFPHVARFCIWTLSIVVLIGSILVYLNKSEAVVIDKKSLIFLFIASLLFLILPIGWAMGMPWHLSLTLVCLSMMMGWSVEYVCHLWIKKTIVLNLLGITIAILIGLIAIPVNDANIKKYASNQSLFLPLTLSRNAVLHPPDIKNKLFNNSVIVVENSMQLDPYLLGNGTYPLVASSEPNALYSARIQKSNFIKMQSDYNGFMFRWAYLMPSLREEIYPFSIDKMNNVPDIMIYNWLQQYNNIFCLGYDKNANWHDRTSIFKKNLLKEKASRAMIINLYDFFPGSALNGVDLYAKNLSYPDVDACQMTCDQDKNCRGFTYISVEAGENSVLQCRFLKSIAQGAKKFCSACIGYVKGARVV